MTNLRRPRFKDLFVDAATGRLSHTKLWNNVASAVLTWLVVYLAVHAESKDLGTITEFALWYLAILGGGAVLSKGVGFGFGRGKADGGEP